MNDDEIIRKYNRLTDDCESRIDDNDSHQKKIDANNAVAILYINENYNSIKKAFRGYDRVGQIIKHIELNIGSVDPIIVFRQLRKKFLFDCFDVWLVVVILFVASIFTSIYFFSENADLTQIMYSFGALTILFMFLAKVLRHLYYW